MVLRKHTMVLRKHTVAHPFRQKLPITPDNLCLILTQHDLSPSREMWPRRLLVYVPFSYSFSCQPYSPSSLGGIIVQLTCTARMCRSKRRTSSLKWSTQNSPNFAISSYRLQCQEYTVPYPTRHCHERTNWVVTFRMLHRGGTNFYLGPGSRFITKPLLMVTAQTTALTVICTKTWNLRDILPEKTGFCRRVNSILINFLCRLYIKQQNQWNLRKAHIPRNSPTGSFASNDKFNIDSWIGIPWNRKTYSILYSHN